MLCAYPNRLSRSFGGPVAGGLEIPGWPEAANQGNTLGVPSLSDSVCRPWRLVILGHYGECLNRAGRRQCRRNGQGLPVGPGVIDRAAS